MKTGLTGGIGSGKSFVADLLRRRGVEVYDCDQAAKRLMVESEEIRCELKKLVGNDAYLEDGRINKPLMAQFLLSSTDNRKALDEIVHPAVFRDFENSRLQWVESAILFESGLWRLVDRKVLVSCPLETRISRIVSRDRINREKALEWISQQWPSEKLRELCDYEITNDGISDLDSQIDKLLYDIGQQKQSTGTTLTTES